MNKVKEEMLIKLQNVENMEKSNLEEKSLENEVKIDDVKYLGKAKVVQEIDGKKEEFEINVYAVIEGKTIKYYSDDMYLGVETLNVGEGKPAIIPSYEYILKYEENSPIKDIIENLKQKEFEEKDIPKEEKTQLSLNELKEEKIEEYSKQLGKDKEDVKSVTEIKKEENTKKFEKMNHLQEIDSDTRVNYYKDIEKTLGLSSVQKFAIVYSEDAVQLSENGKRNSSRYSMIAVMDDGSMLNLEDKLEEVKSEGSNTIEDRIQTGADEKTRIENNPASMYRIKGTNEVFSFENGQYGEIKVHYGNFTLTEGTKFVGTQIETDSIWYTSTDVREQASDRKGVYYTEEKLKETEKHIEEHKENEVDIKDSDGNENTFECIEQNWKELATKWGYYKDGKPDEEKAKKIYTEYKYDNPHLSDEKIIQEISDDLYEQMPGINNR